jgi:site-specific DNA-methyltransferase (adenine-specific)
MTMEGIQPGTVLCADCLFTLRQLPPGSIDALITDPPYSSGGLYRSDRVQATGAKYGIDAAAGYARHDFTGDNLDQRAYIRWAAEWLSLARAAAKPGAVAAVFTAWRQLASVQDALQWAGWVSRGILCWDKINARPMPGRPRQQCEFILWASNGPLSVKRAAPYLPGVFRYPTVPSARRQHQAEKPLGLMRELVHICIAGGLILDPFAGAGTTLEAAALEGFSWIGIEIDPYYAEIARQRPGN